jgi:hypothetical protein
VKVHRNAARGAARREARGARVAADGIAREETMDVTLQDSEVNLLVRVLTQDLSSLRMEISNTESYDMRESLKGDEEVLKSIIRRLNPTVPL